MEWNKSPPARALGNYRNASNQIIELELPTGQVNETRGKEKIRRFQSLAENPECTVPH